MRLWSLHPKHLDAKGIVALWREALLAKHVLEGKTKGYKNHPQLNRFKKLKHPVAAINRYLLAVYKEAVKRDYNFDPDKINHNFTSPKIPVTKGQIDYEIDHLLKKLKIRDPERFNKLKKQTTFPVHPLFKRVPGKVEDWEIIPKKK
jgi:hypothetical protein